MKKSTLLSCLIGSVSLIYGTTSHAATETVNKTISLDLANGGCSVSVTDRTLSFSDYVRGSGLDSSLPTSNPSSLIALSSIRPEQLLRFGYTVSCDDARTISSINIGRNAGAASWTASHGVNYLVLVPETDTDSSGLTASNWIPHHKANKTTIPVAAGGSYTNYAHVAVDRSAANVGAHTSTDLLVRVTY